MCQSKRLEQLPPTQWGILQSLLSLNVSPGTGPPHWAPSLGILKMPLAAMQEGLRKGEREKESPRQTRPFREPEQRGRAQSIPDRPLISAALGDQWGETFRSQDASITRTASRRQHYADLAGRAAKDGTLEAERFIVLSS